MVRKKKIKLEVFDAVVTVIVTDNIRQVYNNIQRKNPNVGPPMTPEEGDILGLAVWDHTSADDRYLIFAADSELDIGLIAHECFHMTLALAEFYDIPLNGESEPPAYLNEFLVKNVARYLHG